MARVIEREVKVYAPKALTANAHMILRDLADSAGIDHRMVWIGINTLAHGARCTISTVYAALKQLRDLNIIAEVPEDEWPAEARRYKSVVRKINPVSEWSVVYDMGAGEDVAPEQLNSGNRNDLVQKSDPNQELLNQELKTVEATSSLLRIPAGSMKKSEAASDAELDPASSVGPYAVSAAPKKLGPSGNPDSSMGLASYFRETLQGTEFGRKSLLVPDAINYRILASVLGRWIKDGTSPHLIRSMMDDYAASGQRTAGVPAWKSFLASRALLARASDEADDRSFQDKIMNDPSSPEFLAYWGVSAEDIAPLDGS